MKTTIKRAFEGGNLSIKRLSDRSGVPYSACHGFLTGDRNLGINYLERLCRVLGLRLVADKRKRR